MITFMHPLQSPFRYKALSTDEKPTDATYGSMLLEEDTDIWYIFYGGVWSVASTSSFDPSSGTLTVYHDVGEGEDWGEDVKGVVIADTVRSIGAGAFASLDSLEYVSIPAGVEVEDGAFSQTFKDPFDADVAMADVAGYEYVAYEGVMYQCDPAAFIYNGSTLMGYASGYSGMVNMVIPSHSTSGNVVTGTAVDSFVNSASLTKVFMLPDSGLTTLGVRTFQGCTSLSYIRLMDPLASLGSYAIQGCTSLTSIEFPSSMRVVGTFCFRSDTQLESVVLNKGLTSLEEHAFRDCSAIKSVAFPSTIETISNNVFNGCRDVAEVSFAEGFNATIASTNSFSSWTFYAADGTTVIDKTVASNLAGKTFKGSASRLVEDAGPQPGMEGRYMYAITTDSAGMNILSVQAAHDGRPLDTIVTASTRRQGAENIPEEWGFVNGVGPFKCWYGAFNIQDYVAGTEDEAPVCTGAGMLAYRLDPYDLGTTMQGTELQGTYNVFLVVPTVYWKAVGNILYLSDDASYAGMTGMTAYAHTATSEGVETVFPYLGIGVYEAHSEDGILKSVSGATPTVNLTCDQFKALCDAMTPAEGSGYQQWNLFQWTLYKIMCYTVMGTENSQWMMGDGPTQNDLAAPSVTGQADLMGPYAPSTKQYDKVFIENSWGSVWQFLGDVSVDDHQLCAGNALGGALLGSGGNQPALSGIVLPSSSNWVTEAYLDGAAWNMTKTVGADNHADPAYLGDYYYQAAGWRCCIVGGRWNGGSSAGLSCVNVSASLSLRIASLGARLAYLMAADAAAPAPSLMGSGRADVGTPTSVKSAGALQQGREDLARMVDEAQEEAAQAMAEGLAQPEEDAGEASADAPAEDGAEETDAAEEGTILI